MPLLRDAEVDPGAPIQCVRLFRVVKTLYGMHPPMLSVRQSSDVMVELHDMSL